MRTSVLMSDWDKLFVFRSVFLGAFYKEKNLLRRLCNIVKHCLHIRWWGYWKTCSYSVTRSYSFTSETLPRYPLKTSLLFAEKIRSSGKYGWRGRLVLGVDRASCSTLQLLMIVRKNVIIVRDGGTTWHSWYWHYLNYFQNVRCHYRLSGINNLNDKVLYG